MTPPSRRPQRYSTGFELGRIGRQPFQRQPALLIDLVEIVEGGSALVGGQTVPEEGDRSRKLAAQGLEIIHQVRTFDRAFLEAEAQPDRASAGSADQDADRGETLPIEVMNQLRGLPARSPGAADGRLLGKAALVEKDQERPVAAGFFLMPGQVRVFQW
jgi:hypothetical protein